MVVSPTDPDNKEEYKATVATAALRDDWVAPVKRALEYHTKSQRPILKELYKPGQDSKESSFIIYMRTTSGKDGPKWYSSDKDAGKQPLKDELINAPEFIVADSEGTWPG
eukprot:GHVU01172452.1.p1 GENE.GHVU01172452.1~~GHVU01172452.1.p1  ORF type:complete len:110 (-),score=17.28 GHVU01172452.1:459-788(-)